MVAIPLTRATVFVSVLAAAFLLMAPSIIYLAINTPLPDTHKHD